MRRPDRPGRCHARFLDVWAVAIVGLAATVPAVRPVPLAAQDIPSDSAVRAIITERVDAGRFAGIAIGFVTPDGRCRVVAYGPHAGVEPFDGNTVFEIGSITKTFTAGILADMVRKGEVALDDPVARYLPEGTVVPSRDGRQITLADLASQSSGLPRMPDNMDPADPANPYADYTTQQMFAFLAGYTLPRAIGTQYEYSNLGFALLGQALAYRAGESYESLVTGRLLRPLGMTDTRITLSPSMQQRLAPGHAPDGSPAPNWDLPSFAGAGALRSTVSDMLTWIHANADSTSSPLGRTLVLTHAERQKTGSPAMTVGLAWHRLKTPAGRIIVWHNGGTGGYRTFTGYDEATGTAIVVLSNTQQSVDEIGFHLLDASVPLPPLPKKRTAIQLRPEVLEQYIGTYTLSPDFDIVVTREGDQLFGQATGQGKFELFAESESDFFLKVVDAQMSFTRDSTGAVTGLVLHQNGANVPGRRK